MTPTSASQSTASSCAFFSSPFRLFEKLAVRFALSSILRSSTLRRTIFPLPLPSFPFSATQAQLAVEVAALGLLSAVAVALYPGDRGAAVSSVKREKGETDDGTQRFGDSD